MDIPCYCATKTKITNQITECGNKASTSKGHRRMDTKCMHGTISHAKPSESHSYLVLSTALDGDDQIHCFKPEENPFVAILDVIAEATPTEMLIDEDEEGDEGRRGRRRN